MSEATARAGWREVRPDALAEPTRVANRIVQILQDAGVQRTFGIPGGTISPIFDALLDVGIEHVTCQHESMAVYMAAGYARATGRPSVVLVTSGPGVLNAMTGLAAAYHDETPVLVLAGDVATPNEGRGALQDGSDNGMSIVGMVSSITKFAGSLDQPARAESLVRNALQTMTKVPRGPALLRLPLNHTGEEARQEVLDDRIAVSGETDTATCSLIANQLAEAERPAIFAGGGIRWGEAEQVLRRLVEITRCPVITDIESKGAFPESNPLSLGLFGVGGTGRAARYLANGVDVLVTIGARLDDTTTSNYSPLLQPEGTLIQIDHDPRRLGRSYMPDIVLGGELPTTLERICSLLPTISADVLLKRDAALHDVEKTVFDIPELGRAPHDPRAVVLSLQQAFPEDAVFATDIGNHHLFASTHLRCDLPDQFHISNGLGGMTSGIGLAMGLQQAYGRSRQVVGICGDGGLLMGGNELATCAKYDIPIVLAVFNDGQLGMVQHGSERLYGRSHDFRSPDTDLCAYATALGAKAIRVETLADLVRASQHDRRGPLLLDIPINPNVRALNPRDAVLNFPKAG